MSVTRGAAWIPTTALIVGALLLTGVRAQSRPELRMPLADALPDSVGDWLGTDLEVTDAEADVAGFTDYALRVFQAPDGAADRWASVYLGFYDQQSRGRTIHSPKNCLPGSGWEALSATTQDIQVDGETFTVNRYIIQEGERRALVLYWYQGRGRVAHNEYLVKIDLLRDAALKRRTDEALVRVIVPLWATEEEALVRAVDIASELKIAMDTALPL